MIKKLVILPVLLLLLAVPMAACTGSPGSAATTATTNPPTATAKLTALKISVTTPVQIPPGLSKQLVATGTFDDGSTADVSAKATWTSTDPGIATVSSGGQAKAFNLGATKITAALSGITSQPIDVAVVGVPMVDMDPYPLPNLVPMGTLQLNARFMNSVTGRYDYVPADSWISSDPSVAGVNSVGLLTALKAGSVTITASYLGYKSLAFPLTVVPFLSIYITPGTTSNLQTGLTVQFKATAAYPDGTTQDITANASWVSSNLQVAAFSSPGVIVGGNPGYTSIQAGLQGISSPPVLIAVN